MALQIRKVTESQREQLILKAGEPLYTIDTNKLYVGDGQTRGGLGLLDGIALLEFLDTDIDHNPLEDNDFIYWKPSSNRWAIGKRYKALQDLADVALEADATNVQDKQILMYSQATGKWTIKYDTADQFGIEDLEDVSGSPSSFYDSERTETHYSSLQYNATTAKWDVIELPRTPNVGEMEEVTLTANPQLGQMLFIDPSTQKYVNDYANQDLSPAYNCGLYQIQNKDIIKFSSSVGKFINHTPKLAEDVPEISISALSTWEPADQEYSVMMFGENAAFAINNERAHTLTAFKNRKLVFDLSDATLLNLNFKFSAQPDGTHSLDPVGTIWSSSLVTETGTPGIDGRVEIDLPTYFADQATSSYWINTETDPEQPPVYSPPAGDDEIPEITFTVLGSVPDPNASLEDLDSGEGNVEDGEIEQDLPGLYYFSPENAEFGAKIQINEAEDLPPFTLFWDGTANGFNVKRFDVTVGSLGDVEIIPDTDGFLFDNQMLSFDSSTQKWTTPLDRVVGLGIASSLPRRFQEFANMLWAGGAAGLGEFTYSMPAGAEIESITINLNELEVEGSDQEFDAFFFDTEEDREYFYELLEEAETADVVAGGTGELSRQVINDLASDANAKVMRIRTRKKSYSRAGRSKSNNSQEYADVIAEYSQGGVGGGGSMFGGGPSTGGSGLGGGRGGLGGNGRESAKGAGFGGDGWSGSAEGQTEPSLDDLVESEEFPDPAATAEAFVEAYQNFGNNTKQIFGVMLARQRAFEALMPKSTRDPNDSSVADSTIDASDRFSNELQLQFDLIDVSSDPTPPQMFGWRQSTDTYGYYYFTFAQRNSQLTFNTRNHELIAHSYMRRVGCTHSRTGRFQVEFYYDADDSTKMAGEWLRIVEFQSAQSAYNGTITEVASTTIREGLEEWSDVVLYQKGNRVLYDDKVWECLVRTTKGFPPASGTAAVPTQVVDSIQGGLEISTFVEIPRFSVKSQRFEGVYQLRCTYGSNTQGGKTHPAFRFSEDAGDEADYIYIGAELMTHNNPSDITSGGTNSYTAARATVKAQMETMFLDTGMYLFDINVHSLLQHLMVSEFQTMNIEKALGEDNGTYLQGLSAQHSDFIRSVGNGSGYYPYESQVPAGVGGTSVYRGIHRIYGNTGYHIDGMNIDPTTLEVYYQVDNFLYNSDSIKPEGYLDLHPLPQMTLDSSGSASDWIRDFWNFIREDFSDFVYYLPRYAGGNRELYLADKLYYRDLNSANSQLPLKAVIGKNIYNRSGAENGGYGPHSITIHPNPAAAARLIVRRKGAALVPSTQGTGQTITYGNLFNVDNEILISGIPQPDPADLAAGDYWVSDFVIEKQQPVVGKSSVTGKTGARTISLARLLASKSAICIGITDESDSQTVSGMYDKWEEFRNLFPRRNFNLLVPLTTQKTFEPARMDSFGITNPNTSGFLVSGDDLTNPIHICPRIKNTLTVPSIYRYGSSYIDKFMVERACYLDTLFPNITEFFPTSENARSSFPMSYRWRPQEYYLSSVTEIQDTAYARSSMTSGGYTDFLKDNAVTAYDLYSRISTNLPLSTGNRDEVPSLQGRTFTFRYKVRIPAYVSTTANQVSDGVVFKYVCDGNMTVDVYNPHTDNTINIVTDYNSYSTDGTTSFTGTQVESNFTPVDLANDDAFLEIRVEFTHNTGSEIWFDNPGLFALSLYVVDNTDSTSNPYYVPIFIAQDYTSPFTQMYGPPTQEVGFVVRQPMNHALDPHSTGRSYGPFNIGRDNGTATDVTDIFELCGLQNAIPGTLVGLFVDRSGSMTQSTIQSAYTLLYQKCAAAQLEIIEVQNSNEDWILPFIQEI